MKKMRVVFGLIWVVMMGSAVAVEPGTPSDLQRLGGDHHDLAESRDDLEHSMSSIPGTPSAADRPATPTLADRRDAGRKLAQLNVQRPVEQASFLQKYGGPVTAACAGAWVAEEFSKKFTKSFFLKSAFSFAGAGIGWGTAVLFERYRPQKKQKKVSDILSTPRRVRTER